MCFAKPIDVMTLINRNLVSQPIEQRAMPRVEIRCSAYVKRGEDYLPATVRNISAGGLQVEGDSLPPEGSYVSVFIEPYRADRHTEPMFVSLGATVTFSQRQGDWWVTVVGDTPPATLKMFAAALERKKP